MFLTHPSTQPPPQQQQHTTAGDAGRLYESVHSQLFNLPDATIVYPAHDYKGRTASSIGEEKAHNLRLTKPKEEFVEIMDSLGLPPPKQLDRAVPANLKVRGRV